MRWSCDDAERRACDSGVRDWSEAATNQRMPVIAGNHQKLGERQRTDFPLELSEGRNPTDTMILGIWPLK